MKIIKHNKNNQEFSLDKLSKFLDKVFYGLKISKQDLLNDFESTLFGKKSVDSLDMYDLLINTSLKKCVFTGSNFHDLEWSKVSQRLKLKKLYKEIAITRNSKKLEPYNNFSGFIDNLNHLIKKEVFSKELNHLIEFYNMEIYYKIINSEFDNNYDFAGFNLLCDRYLTKYEGKIVELPQELYLIIAMLLANISKDYHIKKAISQIQKDISDYKGQNAKYISEYRKYNEFHYEKTKEFYEAIASGKISLATPILSNLRKKDGSLASCFIDSINDSWLDIAESIKRIGLISKNGGGVGVNISRIRASGSYVNKVKGASSGVINWIKLINDTGVAVNQNGNRSGAVTVALDTWHLDIESFLDIQTENGDQRNKAYDIFPQVVISDLFMQRCENNEMWTLFDPYEIRTKYNKELCELWGAEFETFYSFLESEIDSGNIKLFNKISARELIKKIMKTTIETGMPYVFFKDTVNKANPNKNEGMIGNANLCVSGNTPILTKDGYKIIREIAGTKQALWNGEEWSESEIFQTGENQELFEVEFSDGNIVQMTEYHSLPIMRGSYSKLFDKKQLHECKIGDRLIKFELPLLEGDLELPDYLDAYTYGFFCGDGTITATGRSLIPLYGIKRDLRDFLKIKSFRINNGRDIICLDPRFDNKFFVPDNQYTVKTRLEYLAGLMDSDGCFVGNISRNGGSVQITSIHLDFLKRVKLSINSLGIKCRIKLAYEKTNRMMPDGNGGQKSYTCQKLYRLTIATFELNKLIDLGLITYRLPIIKAIMKFQQNQFIFIKSINKVDGLHNTYCFTEPKRNMGVFNDVLLFQCVESFSNFKPTVMKSTNEVLNQGEIHVCSLASLNLSILLNLEDIKKYTRIEIEILDNIIDLTKSPIIEGDIHNNKYRIIGGGLMGYADHLAIKKIRYNDSKAVDYSKELAYNIYITAVEKSAELAKERGSYPAWKNAELPLLSELMEFPQNDYEDNLRNMILNYGLRNGSLLAIAPNTSTSVLLGCSSSFLPVFNKFFIDKNSKGSVPVYAKYLSPETFWYYQENKNLDQQHIINITSALQQWVDQGISMEWYIDVNKVEAIDFYNLYMNVWKQKCKTVYYIRQLKLKKEECISCAN